MLVVVTVRPDSAAGRGTDPAAPGRRELNKARTREAIVGALRELVAELPAAEITVEQVAERAGVSRRTFFNYFGGIPAVLSDVFAEHAAAMIAQLDPDVIGGDPVTALRGLVRTHGIPEDLLGWFVALNRHGADTDATILLERTVWADMAAWLRERLRAVLPEADPLFVATLASAVMSCFQATEEVWLKDLDTECPEPLPRGDVATFHDHLDRALGLLADGWRSPSS